VADAEKVKAEKAAKEAAMNPEEQYRKLVEEANRDDPWKEPIKDLIDKYADIADQHTKDRESALIARITEKLGVTSRNNYGNQKVNSTTTNTT
jgi:hypothetical protein